jgi:hypothetical protein
MYPASGANFTCGFIAPSDSKTEVPSVFRFPAGALYAASLS